MAQFSDRKVVAIKRDDIKLLTLDRTEGCFGWYKGQCRLRSGGADAASRVIDVGVKLLSTDATVLHIKALTKEAAMLSHFDHPNVLKLIGMHRPGPPVMLIHEDISTGSLIRYLKKDLDAAILRKFAVDICKGMNYLHRQKVVHWDLASRNIYLNPSLQCKIANLGREKATTDKAPDGFYTSPAGTLLMRWSPPEVGMTEGSIRRVNPAEDLWCFGFLLYEIYTKGRIPYGKSTWTDPQQYLDTMVEMQEGGILPQPEVCPDDAYSIMVDCWSHDPKDRPTFASVESRLSSADAFTELEQVLASVASAAIMDGFEASKVTSPEPKRSPTPGGARDHIVPPQAPASIGWAADNHNQDDFDPLQVDLDLFETSPDEHQVVDLSPEVDEAAMRSPTPQKSLNVDQANDLISALITQQDVTGFPDEAISPRSSVSPLDKDMDDDLDDSADRRGSKLSNRSVSFADEVTVIRGQDKKNKQGAPATAAPKPALPTMPERKAEGAVSSQNGPRNLKKRPTPFASNRPRLSAEDDMKATKPLTSHGAQSSPPVVPAASPALDTDIPPPPPTAQELLQSAKPTVRGSAAARARAAAQSASSTSSASTPERVTFRPSAAARAHARQAARPRDSFPSFASANATYSRLAETAPAAAGQPLPPRMSGDYGFGSALEQMPTSQSTKPLHPAKEAPMPVQSAHPATHASAAPAHMLYPPLNAAQEQQMQNEWQRQRAAPPSSSGSLLGPQVHTTSRLLHENATLRADLIAMRNAVAEALDLAEQKRQEREAQLQEIQFQQSALAQQAQALAAQEQALRNRHAQAQQRSSQLQALASSMGGPAPSIQPNMHQYARGLGPDADYAPEVYDVNASSTQPSRAVLNHHHGADLISAAELQSNFERKLSMPPAPAHARARGSSIDFGFPDEAQRRRSTQYGFEPNYSQGQDRAGPGNDEGEYLDVEDDGADDASDGSNYRHPLNSQVLSRIQSLIATAPR